jgi:hypothetical protein
MLLTRSVAPTLKPALSSNIPQLAQQFVASFHYVNRHHNLDLLGPNDKIRDVKQEPEQREGEDLRTVAEIGRC